MQHGLPDKRRLLRECEEHGLRAQIRALLDARRASASSASGEVEDLTLTGAAILNCADDAMDMLRRLVPPPFGHASAVQHRPSTSSLEVVALSRSDHAIGEPVIVTAIPNVHSNGQPGSPSQVSRLHWPALPQEQIDTPTESLLGMATHSSVEISETEESECASLPRVFSTPPHQPDTSTTSPRVPRQLYDDTSPPSQQHFLRAKSPLSTLVRPVAPIPAQVLAQPSKTVNSLPWNLLQYSFDYLLSNFSDLVVATHVCSHWRNFALNTPGLWTNLTLSDRQLRGPASLKSLLVRSKTRKIDVDFTVPGADAEPTFVERIFGELHHQMNRLRTLVLRYEGAHRITRSLQHLLGAAAPSLERFELRMVVPFSIPGDLFNGHAPRLRHLAVHFRHMFADRVGPTGCPALQAVTTLVSLDNRVTPPLNDRYSRLLLHLLPNLKQLQLCSAVCPPNEDPELRLYTTEPLSSLEFTVPSAARNHGLAMYTLQVFDARRVKRIVIHDAPSTTILHLMTQCDSMKILSLAAIFLPRRKLVNFAWRDERGFKRIFPFASLPETVLQDMCDPTSQLAHNFSIRSLEDIVISEFVSTSELAEVSSILQGKALRELTIIVADGPAEPGQKSILKSATLGQSSGIRWPRLERILLCQRSKVGEFHTDEDGAGARTCREVNADRLFEWLYGNLGYARISSPSATALPTIILDGVVLVGNRNRLADAEWPIISIS